MPTDIIAATSWCRRKLGGGSLVYHFEMKTVKSTGETIASLTQAKDVIYLGIPFDFSTVFISTLSFAFREYECVSWNETQRTYKASTIDRYRSDRSNQTLGVEGVGWGKSWKEIISGLTETMRWVWMYPRGETDRSSRCVEGTPRFMNRRSWNDHLARNADFLA